MVSRGTTSSFGVPAEKDDKRQTTAIDTLDAYALERWEVSGQVQIPTYTHTMSLIQTILHYMVSSGQGQLPTKPSQGVLYLLQRSGLMKSIQ